MYVSPPGGKSRSPLHAALLHLRCAGSGALWQTGSVRLLGVNTHTRTHVCTLMHKVHPKKKIFSIHSAIVKSPCLICSHLIPPPSPSSSPHHSVPFSSSSEACFYQDKTAFAWSHYLHIASLVGRLIFSQKKEEGGGLAKKKKKEGT